MTATVRILEIQGRLQDLGIYDGKLDGIIGPRTREAVKVFQATRGLVQDGIPGPVTREALFAGIAPPAPPARAAVKSVWPRQKDMDRFYGPRGANQTRLVPPYQLIYAWDVDADQKVDDPVPNFSIHERCHDSARRVLERVADLYHGEVPAPLRLFGGCLNNRLMRGSKSSWSMHAWGAAIDWDPEFNQLHWHKPKARLSRPEYAKWWELWEAEGWYSLGRKQDYDWMHTQACTP